MNPALFDWIGLIAAVRLARWRSASPNRLTKTHVSRGECPPRMSDQSENPAELRSAGQVATKISEGSQNG
jgi:hypothetical protein